MHAIKPHLAGKKHIIWDWNGTLLNDVEIAVTAISGLLADHQLKPITIEEYREKFRFPVIEYYRALGFDFERHSFEVVGTGFIERYYAIARQCQLFEGAREFLHGLRQEGVSHSILSAAQESHLLELTAHYQIRELFDHVYGLSDHYAASKVERGLQLILDSGIDPASTIMIGDTDHDLAVGKAMGVDVLLLADGHQSYSRLRAVHSNVLESRYGK